MENTKRREREIVVTNKIPSIYTDSQIAILYENEIANLADEFYDFGEDIHYEDDAAKIDIFWKE